MSQQPPDDAVQTLKEEFGVELRRLRKAADLTQEALATQMGYHRVSVTQVEKCRQDFSRQFVIQAEVALDAQGKLLAIYDRLDAARGGGYQANPLEEPPTNRRHVFYALGAFGSGASPQHDQELLNSDDAYTVELLHDEALKCIGRYEFGQAAKHLESALILTAKPRRRNREWNFLRARCLGTLASIRRDKGQLGGSHGALAYYLDCLDFYLSENETARAVELCLYVGACHEMSDQFPYAWRYYRMGEGLSQRTSASLPSGARCVLRQGTVLTKLGRYDSARKRIIQAQKNFMHLSAERLVAFSTEKLALVDCGASNFSRALSLASSVRGQVSDKPSLRNVQSSLVLATIMHGCGETEEAMRHVSAAMTLSSDLSLGHQFTAAAKIYQRVAGEQPSGTASNMQPFVPVIGNVTPRRDGA